MVKVGVKSRASGGQRINPLDPRFVTVTDLWSVTVTIKACLASPLFQIRQKRDSQQGQARHLSLEYRRNRGSSQSSQNLDAFEG